MDVLTKWFQPKTRWLYSKKIHVSWLIAWFGFSFVIGVYLALYISSFVSNYWLAVVVCLVFVSVKRKDIVAVMVIVIAGLCLGLWRGGNQLQATNQLQQFIGQEVQLRGVVREDPTVDIDGDTKLRLHELTSGSDSFSGDLWVSIASKNEIRRSDIVTVEGVLSQGFGTIPVAMYRARVVSAQDGASGDPGRQIRDTLSTGIRDTIREPEASLGAGFLLGEKSALPEKLQNDLRLLGLTHIVVASGYNLTILVRFARRIFTRISRFTGLFASAGLIFWFVQMTGFSPSMSRASIIASISLVAWYYGRKIHPFVLLPLSAAITVMINPTYAWGDIGWLLSFTSFVGVIILAPLIHAYFWGEEKSGTLRQVVIETLSAQLCTLPLILFVFQVYSPLALLANLLILPLIPYAMLLTAFASVGGLLFGTAAGIVGFPAEVLLRYMTFASDKLAQSRFASAEIGLDVEMLLVLYLFLTMAMVYLWRRTGYALRDSNVVE
jgi:competence protein ComEC